MALDTLKGLATSAGLASLTKKLRGVDSFYHEGPESTSEIQEVVRRMIREDPSLSSVKVRATPGIPGGYLPGKDLMALGVLNPAVVAHELAHAKNIRKSKIYSKILGAATGVARLNNTAAIPAMLALRAFIGDKDKRDEVLQILSGASAAVAAPELAEELSASMEALRVVPHKLKAVKTLLPAFLHHTVHSMTPTAIYQFGKYI